jgi:hypothetical protein
LRERCNSLKPVGKVVSVLFDEINVQGKVSYSGGRLEGIALDENKVVNAVRIQAFMITSVFGNYEDIVALYPVKNSTAINLKEWTLHIIKTLTEIGFNVLSLICDNHRLNRGMYKLLCGGATTEESIVNPFNKEQKIFLLFDSVHLFKSIRNNWLNQQNNEQTLVFPKFENFESTVCASVKDLKSLHAKQERSIVKVAPALSNKVLYPSTFERQNVLLACKLFDEKTIVALQTEKNILVDGTIEFLKVVLSWWKIVNVRSPNGHIKLRDPLRAPICGVNDSNVQFLKKFVCWLNAWESDIVLIPDDSCPKHTGKLTPDTFAALRQTCQALMGLIEYAFENFNCNYILLGKLSTDNLEGRFGRYRQLSGANYNVSVRQVVDSEKKLKVLNLLQLASSSFGNFSLKHFNLEETVASNESDDSVWNLAVEFPLEIISDRSDDVVVTDFQMAPLLYIAGYVSHALLKYFGTCQTCTQRITLGKDMVLDTRNTDAGQYMKNLSRGGLKEPTDFIFQLVIKEFQIFSCLISNDFEEKFAKCEKQRIVLKFLSKAIFEEHNEVEKEECNCGKTVHQILDRACHITANIFLNNYAKVSNDKPSTLYPSGSRSKQRKLQTFK